MPRAGADLRTDEPTMAAPEDARMVEEMVGAMAVVVMAEVVVVEEVEDMSLKLTPNTKSYLSRLATHMHSPGTLPRCCPCS